MTLPRLDPRPTAEPLPAIIYHYTTPLGLIGIIENRVIWASHINHLNDEREVGHARELIDDVTYWLHEPRTDGLEEQAAHLRGAIQTIKEIHNFTNFFVTSFSAEWNSLSQWDRYAGFGGYAVGIDPTFFKDEGRVWNEKVNYDRDDQLEMMKGIVTAHLSGSKGMSREALPSWGIEVGSQLVVCGLACKSEGFKEEKEWRIVKAFPRDEVMEIEFRAGQFGVVPYHRIPIKDAEGMTPIREIVIGPTHYWEDAVRAVELFLKSRGLENAGIEIRESRIPIR
jgi:hypothetical protein